MSRRVRVAKTILWTLLGLAAGVSVVRFTRGLGATTALTDSTPWGLWIGFDVMGGVALAAGGFVVAALGHIFQRPRYRHAVRPAMLSALLGYGAVVVGLIYDLGLPWNIWRLTIFWNPRSPPRAGGAPRRPTSWA
jgi:Ni/Fe-hydrogenase subunit HybB-like protein